MTTKFSVLSYGVDEVNRTTEFLDHCGALYCNDFAGNTSDSSSNHDEDGTYKITIMSAIYLSCALSSVFIVAILVDPLSRYENYTIQLNP